MARRRHPYPPLPLCRFLSMSSESALASWAAEGRMGPQGGEGKAASQVCPCLQTALQVVSGELRGSP